MTALVNRWWTVGQDRDASCQQVQEFLQVDRGTHELRGVPDQWLLYAARS